MSTTQFQSSDSETEQKTSFQRSWGARSALGVSSGQNNVIFGVYGSRTHRANPWEELTPIVWASEFLFEVRLWLLTFWVGALFKARSFFLEVRLLLFLTNGSTCFVGHALRGDILIDQLRLYRFDLFRLLDNPVVSLLLIVMWCMEPCSKKSFVSSLCMHVCSMWCTYCHYELLSLFHGARRVPRQAGQSLDRWCCKTFSCHCCLHLRHVWMLALLVVLDEQFWQCWICWFSLRKCWARAPRGRSSLHPLHVNHPHRPAPLGRLDAASWQRRTAAALWEGEDGWLELRSDLLCVADVALEPLLRVNAL